MMTEIIVLNQLAKLVVQIKKLSKQTFTYIL